MYLVFSLCLIQHIHWHESYIKRLHKLIYSEYAEGMKLTGGGNPSSTTIENRDCHFKLTKILNSLFAQVFVFDVYTHNEHFEECKIRINTSKCIFHHVWCIRWHWNNSSTPYYFHVSFCYWWWCQKRKYPNDSYMYKCAPKCAMKKS